MQPEDLNPRNKQREAEMLDPMHGENLRLHSSNGGWVLTEDRLKGYPHFDAVISSDRATAYVTDPGKVAAHAFLPFIEYEKGWTRYARKGEPGKRKVRKIRYAARRDSYIYTYYRHVLADAYEAELERLGLSECVLAYRRLRTPTGAGKSNIHFAVDAFDAMVAMGNCTVTALDISQFFERIDHERLKDIWRHLLNVERLPGDHFAVFRAMTSYSIVPQKDAYRRLGLFGVVPDDGPQTHERFLVDRDRMPTQLCDGKAFRQRIAGSRELKSLIHKNYRSYGIPQGAPLSDLLANMYMLAFDQWMHERVSAVGGKYFRYSDDILIIVPGANKRHAKHWMKAAIEQTAKYGRHLEIKMEKSAVHTIKRRKAGAICKRVGDDKGSNGVEYLGFRFDGERIYLRDATLSSLHRKIAGATKALVLRHARRHPTHNAQQLLATFDIEGLMARFGRVPNFEVVGIDKRSWTFWTYASRAIVVAGPRGITIKKQLRGLRDHIIARVGRAVNEMRR